MPQINTPSTDVRRDALPLAGRSMELRAFTRVAAPAEGDAQQAPLATAEIVFTTGAGVQRYDWYRDRAYIEELVVEDGAIRLDRLQRGAPLLNSHSAWDLEDQLGVVDSPSISNGQGLCSATFSRRPSVAGYVQDVEDRIIRNVSVGYVRHRIEMVAPMNDGDPWVYRVIDWEPYEVSLVTIPADMDSQVRSASAGGGESPDQQQATALRHWPCEFITRSASPAPAANPVPAVGLSAETQVRKEGSMPQTQAAGGATAPASNQTGVDTTRSQPAAAQPDAAAQAAADAAARAAEIVELCSRHRLPHLAADMIRSGQTVDQARAAVLNELASRDAGAGGHLNVRDVRTVQDEMGTRLAGMQQAILNRINPAQQLDDNGRQYRGLRLIELGRDFLESQGVSTRGLAPIEVATRMLQYRGGGMNTTADFSSLFANVANKRLRDAYTENPGTYRIWARRAPNAPDFKNIQVTALSGAPDLLQTNEHGEFKYGTMKDGAETYSVVTYGRIVALSRQAIINDDLRGFDRLVTAFGASSNRLENRLVYAQLTGNAALSDGVALFHANHANLGSGSGSSLQFSSISAGRVAMRTQKGLQSEELNIAPRYLIVPAALEQTAYQYTSSQYVPAKSTDVNEFRAGGRTALEPIVEPVLDANSTSAWYLAADNSQIDTVEYCFLDGFEGPVIESEVGFEVDGLSYKCREDFAAKAIDFRGLYKAAGA